MAMSREDQKGPSGRIIAKHPLTEEERRIYERNKRSPDDYVQPADTRICAECGARFTDTMNSKGEVLVSMLEKFSIHQASHNPSPAQWSEAHKRIQDGRASQKDHS
jgi:hypothetical protein